MVTGARLESAIETRGRQGSKRIAGVREVVAAGARSSGGSGGVAWRGSGGARMPLDYKGNERRRGQRRTLKCSMCTGKAVGVAA